MSIISIYDFKINFDLLNKSKSPKVYVFKDKFYLTWSLSLVENKFEFLSESWFFEEEKRLISFEYWTKLVNPYLGNSAKFREEEKVRKMDFYKKNQEELKLYTSFISIYNTFFRSITFYNISIIRRNSSFLSSESDSFFNNYKRKEKEISANLKQLNKKLLDFSSYDKNLDLGDNIIFYPFYFYDNFLEDEIFYENFKFIYKNKNVKVVKNSKSKFNFFKFNSGKKNFISDWSVPKEYTLKEKGLFFFFKRAKKLYINSLFIFLNFVKKKFIQIDGISLYNEISLNKDKAYLLKKLVYSIYLGNEKFDWKTYFFIENNSKLDENINFLDEDDLLDMEDSDIEEIASIDFKNFFYKKLYSNYIGITNKEVFEEWDANELNQLLFLNYSKNSINSFFIKKSKSSTILLDSDNFYNDIFFTNILTNILKKNFVNEIFNERKVFIDVDEIVKNEEGILNLNSDNLKLLDLSQNLYREYLTNSLDLLKEQGNIKKQISYLYFLKKYYSLNLLTSVSKIFSYNNLIYYSNSKNLYNYYNLYNEIILNDFLRQRINKSNYYYDSINSYDLKYRLNKSDSKFSKYSLEIYTKSIKSDGSFSFTNFNSLYNNKILLFRMLSHLKVVLNIIKFL